MIEDLIVKLRDDVAVVIVTHNLQQAYRVADHVAFMYLGELVEYNSATRALRRAPRETDTGVRQRCVRLAAIRAGAAVLPAAACCSGRHGLLDHAGNRRARAGQVRADPRCPQARTEAAREDQERREARGERPSIADPARRQSANIADPADRDAANLSQAHYEPCEECGAPLDPQQRYCVELRGAARQRLQPLLALLRRDEQTGAPADQLASPRRPGGGSRAAAVGFFALLPIAVALGVVVGRSGSGNNEGAPEGASPPRRRGCDNLCRGEHHRFGQKTRRRDEEGRRHSGRGQSKILANTPNGPIHQVLGYKPTKHEAKADTELVKKNAKEVGKSYIKAQQNLPDVIVVGK